MHINIPKLGLLLWIPGAGLGTARTVAGFAADLAHPSCFVRVHLLLPAPSEPSALGPEVSPLVNRQLLHQRGNLSGSTLYKPQTSKSLPGIPSIILCQLVQIMPKNKSAPLDKIHLL